MIYMIAPFFAAAESLRCLEDIFPECQPQWNEQIAASVQHDGHGNSVNIRHMHTRRLKWGQRSLTTRVSKFTSGVGASTKDC